MPGICIGRAYSYPHHLHIQPLYICMTSAYTEHMHTPGAKHPIPDMHHISTPTRERIMRTVSIFKNGNNRAIRLPRDLDFEGVSELEIVREGDSIILRPVRPTWDSFFELERADPDFMAEREDVVTDEGRFDL